MGSIPVAKPKPQPAPFRVRRRAVLLSFLLASAIAALIATVALVWPQPEAGPVSVGGVDQFEPGSVKHFDDDGFFIVRLEDGSFLALHDIATGHLSDPIEWLPDFAFNGATGWFRSQFHSETYDREGDVVFGPAARGMDRYAVTIVRGAVYVETETPYCGGSDTRGSVPCDPDVPQPAFP